MRYIDIHCHPQFAAYDTDRDEVVKRAFDADVGMIVVGTQKDTSQAGVELVNKYPDKPIWAIIGLHPIHTSKSFHDKKELGGDESVKEFMSREEIFDYDFYKSLAMDPKVVGIGEVGLDYYHLEDDTRKKQKDTFEQQIALAIDVKKPLMIHVRNQKGSGGGQAYDDVLDILKYYRSQLMSEPGDIHCFTGDWETGKKFLNLGFTLSFTGVITFPPRRASSSGEAGTNDYYEVVKNTPLDMVMAETDSPYITPVPHRGKRNEPMYVEYVYKKIAEIKNLPIEQVQQSILKKIKNLLLSLDHLIKRKPKI